MKKTLLALAALAGVLAGCSGEEDSPSTHVAEGTPIRVNATVADLATKAGYDPTTPPSSFTSTSPTNTTAAIATTR